MIAYLLDRLVRTYQLLLSPHFGICCRFQPSCSEYARIALKTCRLDRALYLIVRRLFKCHPYSGQSGHDPVPPALQKK